MTHTVPEIRFDQMTDRALLDPESTAALHELSASWADDFRPLRRPVQRAWAAMARLRAREATHMPFPLSRRTAFSRWPPAPAPRPIFALA